MQSSAIECNRECASEHHESVLESTQPSRLGGYNRVQLGAYLSAYLGAYSHADWECAIECNQEHTGERA